LYDAHAAEHKLTAWSLNRHYLYRKSVDRFPERCDGIGNPTQSDWHY